MQSINLNLVPGSFQQVFNCSQGDIGRQLTAKLFDGSTAYEIPAGSTVKIKATKPSGFGFDESATFSGSTVTITTAETMTNEWGRFPAELVITKDGNVIGTANFLFNIEKNPHPDSTVDGDAEEVIPELTLLVERVEAAASSVLDMEVVATTLPAGSQASYSYDEDLNKATFGIPQGEAGAGAAGVVASAYSSSKTYKVGDYVIHNSNLYRCITAITTAEAFTAAHWTQIVLADDVSDLKTDLDNITDTVTSKNLLDKSKLEIGKYLNPSGTYEDLNNRAVTDFIPVKEGDIVLTSFLAGTDVQTAQMMSSICCFNADKTVVTGGVYNKSSFEVPSGVSFVKLTLTSTVYNAETAMVEVSDTTTPSPYEAYFPPITQIKSNIIINKKPLGAYSWQGSLGDGDIIRLPKQNVKNRQVYSFSANITSFDKIRIGRIYDNGTTYGAFEITSTNVIFHCDNGVDYTLTHGLTIENDIQIIIETNNTPFLSVARLYSNGQMYDIKTNLSQTRFIGDEGSPFVSSDGSALTDCSFSWASRNINKPIWLFGDSYMSLYDNRWTYYLVQDGFDASCIINAFAGETSEYAIVSLRNLIKVAQPTYIVWCMGMNDPDTSSAVNATWKTVYDEVLRICEMYGVIPILATIPNTPTMNNVYKNAIVRNSGHRYIDFASAVGASEADSEWFSGMLDSSQSHPTVTGAKALYMRVLADFPEITTLL